MSNIEMPDYHERSTMIWRSDLQPTQKMLLIAFGNHVDSNGRCWPGVHRLAWMIGASEKTVRRTITELVQLGIVRKEGRRCKGHQTSNLYEINFFALPLREPYERKKKADGQNDHQPDGQNDHQPDGQNDHLTNPYMNSLIKKEERDLAKNHTANDRTSEQDRLVSNSSLSLFSEDSQQPTAEQPPTEKEGFEPRKANTTPLLLVDPDRPETIHSATQQQTSVPCAEPIKSEEGGGAAQKTRGLVYKGKGVMAIANLVQFGINRKWWESQQQLAAFQWAIFAAKEQSGYSQPARAVTAIFTGLERKDESAIEEIAGYWARYDQATQTIAAKAAEPMPWVKDGQVIPAYASWVKNPHNGFDVIYSDGTSQLDLILATTKSNKIADRTWQQYQDYVTKEDRRRQQIDADMAKFQAERDAEAAKTPEQRAAEKAEIQKIMAEWRAKNAGKAA
jgi:GntR family transcriptional regulator